MFDIFSWWSLQGALRQKITDITCMVRKVKKYVRNMKTRMLVCEKHEDTYVSM